MARKRCGQLDSGDLTRSGSTGPQPNVLGCARSARYLISINDTAGLVGKRVSGENRRAQNFQAQQSRDNRDCVRLEPAMCRTDVQAMARAGVARTGRGSFDWIGRMWLGARRKMPMIPTDIACDQFKNIYAKWLEGALSSEDAIFQIGDVLQMLDETEAEGAPSTEDQ